MTRQEQQKAYNARHYKERKEIVLKAKDKPCMDCGGSFPPCAMDFDHKKIYRKVDSISNVLHFTIKQLRKEILKCDVVCSNCHRIRTHVNDKSL